MTARQARDEGAAQTRRIVAAMRGLRNLKNWSAADLAAEMTRAGVPWNPDVVVNLEHGRRKSLRVHELLALAFVLDAADPLDLLVPGDEAYPVTPHAMFAPSQVRAWLRGETGPLRSWAAAAVMPPEALEAVARAAEEHGQGELAEGLRQLAKQMAGEGGGDGEG